ncbi:MAG: hypothetical protein HC831_22165 [Chloroflexia bacterium]|nr:hypothetical protein [Chloroflexia bacterium]
MLTILLIQPVTLLLWGLLFIVFWLWFLWPGRGGLAFNSPLNKNNKRVLLEDSLKFIFDCEYNKINCDVNSIAGHLNISIDKYQSFNKQAISNGLDCIKQSKSYIN